jgi:hypothetical protein
MGRLRQAVVVATAAACSVALVAAPAPAKAQGDRASQHQPIRVVASGLEGPLQLSEGRGRLYVMEAGAGQVTRVNRWTGGTRAVVTGLGPNAASGAAPVGDKFAIVTGEVDPSQPAGPYPGSSLLIARRGGSVSQLADLLAYELKHNPDGQAQNVDALSNPFYVLPERHRRGSVLVADGGANDVLRVSPRGKVSTFFRVPTVNTGACRGLENNDPQHPGCDGVPTGLAYGPNNTLYVSALTGEVAGEGRIYVLNASNGRIKRVIKGLTAPTGVAVDRRTGTVYASELLEGLPEGPPPAGFDPATVGQIVRIAPNGRRSYAQVPMPSGLLFTDGKLYASAWSIAGLFFQIPNAGQVVTVGRSAFVPASS